MIKRAFLILLVAITLPLFFIFYGHTQDKPGQVNYKGKESIKVNLKDIDFSQEHLKGYNNLLKIYFICSALTIDDVKVCDKLIYSSAHEQCVKTYNEFMFLWELAKKGRVRPSLITAVVFPAIGKRNIEFVTAFRDKDLKACNADNTNNCTAFLTLNESMAEDLKTKNQIIFMKAVTKDDPAICSKFQEDGMQIDFENICKSMATHNFNLCESCKGVDEFKREYNNYLLRKKEEE